jgi:hypothetical protein
MNDLPQWLTPVISGVIAAVITFFATRRLNSATVLEKDASALKIMTEVADSLARQLRMVESEVPGWKKGMAEATARAEQAEHAATNVKIIQAEAKQIYEDATHLGYFATSPADANSPPALRLKNIKEAAARMMAVEV